MPRYVAPFTKTGSDSVLQLVELLSSATVQRQRWSGLIFGCTASPADASFQYIVRRVTGSATGTSLTPNPTDLQDAACRSSSKHLITADAASFSSGAELFRAMCHHRATYTWNAADGQELVGPATSSAGASLGVAAASTSQFSGSIYFLE